VDKDWQKVDVLLDQALDVPTAEREEFLDSACAGDDKIRAEIESLLACETNAERFLQVPALSFSDGLIMSETAEDLAGHEIGRYRIVRELGRGGMGAVYLAERMDEDVRQLVALKLLKRELNTADIRRRFSHERQILASLDHPQITHLLDVGSTNDGVPFFVMEYVKGVAIDDYRRQKDLSIAEVLKLFRTVCNGVAFAHRKLVVHRDLKPSNILVTDEGIPKLLDFGIAKLLTPEFEESSEHTVTQLGAMSLHYASPEQLRGSPVSTATDIYSLGVVLYELLAGRRPFERAGQSTEEIIRSICETEPQKPSTAVSKSEPPAVAGGSHSCPPATAGGSDSIRNPKSLRGDLDNIVLMALRKEPERRYSFVEEFSEDIRRHLDGLPVIATKDTYGYRASKFVKRHKLGVPTVSLMVLVLVAAVFVTARQARVAQQERDKAQRITDFLQDMLGAAAPDAKGTNVKVTDVLGDASKRAQTELADEPGVMADVLLTLGRTYISLGDYEPAETDLRKALDASLKANGETHPTTATTMSWLGLTLAYLNKEPEGEQISRRALELQRRLHPAGHEDLGVALYSLGTNLLSEGDAKGAVPLLQEAEIIIKQSRGESHGYHLATLSMLGRARQQSGDVDGAESLFRQAIDIGRRIEGRYRIFLAQSSFYLAELLTNKRNYAEAESLLRQSETIYREVLGDSNSNIGPIKLELGRLYFQEGDYTKAEAEFRKSLESLQPYFPREHWLTVTARAALGLTLTRAGKPVEGEPYLREALEIRKQVLSSGNVQIASTESSLGECLTAQKRYAEAEPLLLHSYEELKSKAGEQDQRTIEAHQRLDKLYEARKHPRN